jgi:tetratricopeptide (TPR) repeat protein
MATFLSKARESRLLISSIAFLFSACCFLAGALGHPPTPAKTTASNYVNPAICMTCHQNIARAYDTTGMHRSLHRPTLADTIEDYKTHNTLYNKASGLYYTMLERDGKFYQRRYEIGFDGKETNVVEKQVDYVIGSGNHVRTYLHRGADGRLIEMPVSWYTEKSGYWAMSPGFDRPEYQEDFRRAVPGECLYCHNGLPLQGKYPDLDVTGESIFPKDLPDGIDCQRCHGPGGAHVRAALSKTASVETIRQAIVNPARLSRDRQLEVCMQCHLETSSRLVPNQIRRYDREIGAYKPGDSLGDFTLYFDRGPSTREKDGFEIADHAGRLRMSACFRSSQMTCLTCHNPHEPYRSETSTARYLATCQSCHQSVIHTVSLPAGSNCITCHMPKRRTEDVVHAVMTDHYIQRYKPKSDLLAPLSEAAVEAQGPDKVVLYYPEKLSSTADAALYLASAEVKHGTTMGVAHLQSAIEKYSPSAPQFYVTLGDGYTLEGKLKEGIHSYNEALRRKPNFRPAAQKLAVALMSGGQFSQAAQVLERSLATAPADDTMLSELGRAYLREGLLPRAQRALTHALEVNPDQSDAQNLLGLVAIQQHDPAEAETRFRDAIRSQPNFAEAHNNLANLLTSSGKYPEAEYHFQKAISINPEYAEAHYSYGLLLEVTRHFDQALTELQAAVRLDPKVAQAHDDLGDLLAARGDLAGAAGEYRRAVQLNNRLVDAHISLANILAKQGNLAEAEKELRIAVQLSPSAYEAHLGLGLILMHEGKSAEARLHLEKAAESPDPAIRQAAHGALGR